MSILNTEPQKKFEDPFVTAKGETRAWVELNELKTLWFNTGTRCNLSCENCYIESNPKNDRLSFLSKDDVEPYLKETQKESMGTQEIGFTGGEPFLNPQIISLLEVSLSYGYRTLCLTNAFRIERYKADLLRLSKEYGDKLIIRVSLDHYSKDGHESERGAGTFEPTLKNIHWLFENGISLAIAGRSLKGENHEDCRKGYIQLLQGEGIHLNFDSHDELVVFAEMDPAGDPPEITTACWGILNKNPDDIMCASSRMVVKRKGEEQAKVLACTLLAYDKQFEMGQTLKDSKKSVQLNHKFCAQFCVLGGSSCS